MNKKFVHVFPARSGNAARLNQGSRPERHARERAFLQARRHSAAVRVLRTVFPVLSAGLLAYYGVIFVQIGSQKSAALQSAGAPIIPPNLTFEHPRYEGFGKDGSSYTVTAEQAAQSLTQTHLVSLKTITGIFTGADHVKTHLKATRGEFNTQTSVVELFDGIDIASDNGLTAKLQQATVQTKESVITSKFPVTVTMPAGTVRASSMTVRQKVREVTFSGDVEAHLVQKAEDAGTERGGAGKMNADVSEGGAQAGFGASGEPVTVTANRLDVNDAAKTALFSGDVQAVQGVAVLKAPEMRVFYEGDAAAGGASSAGGGGSKVKRIVAGRPVEVVQGAQGRVTGETAEFDAATGLAVITGEVVITQGETVLRGRHLLMDRASGKTYLTAPPAAEGAAPGRINGHFRQAGSTAAAAAKGAAALKKGETPRSGRDEEAPGEAGNSEDGPALGGAFKADPNAPMDIEADQLEVDDSRKVAIFRGAVQARQGDLVMNANEVHAHYTGDTGLASGAAAARGETGISFVEARGKVTVAPAKSGQTAAGDWAKFDNRDRTAVMGGNVVLTQGQNVVTGHRLTIDLATGESVVGESGAGGGVPVAGQKRPQAVFFPNQLKEENEAKEKGAPRTGAQRGPSLKPAAGGTKGSGAGKKAVEGRTPAGRPAKGAADKVKEAENP